MQLNNKDDHEYSQLLAIVELWYGYCGVDSSEDVLANRYMLPLLQIINRIDNDKAAGIVREVAKLCIREYFDRMSNVVHPSEMTSVFNTALSVVSKEYGKHCADKKRFKE